MLKIIFVLFLCLYVVLGFSQQDTIGSHHHEPQEHMTKKVFNTAYAAPTILLTVGVMSFYNPFLQNQDVLIRERLQRTFPRKTKVDDYTQYAATAAFLGLPAMGIPAKHSFKQRLFTGAVSHGIMASVVNLMKGSINVYRPDGSASNSFPSGHTATAFVGAELFWQEYVDKSIWYGVAGYTVATGTGFFRMYNNKHWFSDVIMGAGIGIMSTKIAYWMLPILDRSALKLPDHVALVPTFNGQQAGMSLFIQL